MRILKSIFAVALSVVMLSACNNLPENTFKLNGKVSNYPNEYIYLSTGDILEGTMVTDSCKVVNGKFSFTGSIFEPSTAILSDKVFSLTKNYQDIKAITFYIEPVKMNFSTDWSADCDMIKQIEMPYTLTGSVTNDESIDLNKAMMSDTTLKDQELRMDFISNYIISHPDSYMSAYYLNIHTTFLPLEQIESLYAGLSEKVKNYTVSKEVLKTVEKIKSVQPGRPAPDFTTNDIKGNRISLSDYRGKTVLLDFWASWCKPCRASMPHVKALYDKYHSKGLEVICVADNDNDNDAWKGAIDQDKTGDFIHVLRGLKMTENGGFDMSEDISDGYDVHYIPSKFIIDAEGNFVCCKASDEELDSKLKEIFGF